MNEDFRMEQGYKEAAYGDSLGRYTAKTFGWMFIGLLITFGVAIGMYMTDGLYYVSRVPGWYYILFIAEIGIVVYLSAMFIDLSAYETVVCAIGIFIFLIVTAYDAKKIQAFYSYYGNVPEMATKSSIFAALQLYLDFINLFVYLLRFVGRRRR